LYFCAPVKVKIIRQTVDNAAGVSLRHYRAGRVYDLPPTLANYLVAQGLATFEMRGEVKVRPAGQAERRRQI